MPTLIHSWYLYHVTLIRPVLTWMGSVNEALTEVSNPCHSTYDVKISMLGVQSALASRCMQGAQ